MRNSMIIKSSNIVHFHPCANNKCDAGLPDEIIKQYYSFDHAINEGWKYTRDALYSHDGTGVFVCPECSKEHNWRKLT